MIEYFFSVKNIRSTSHFVHWNARIRLNDSNNNILLHFSRFFFIRSFDSLLVQTFEHNCYESVDYTIYYKRTNEWPREPENGLKEREKKWKNFSPQKVRENVWRIISGVKQQLQNYVRSLRKLAARWCGDYQPWVVKHTKHSPLNWSRSKSKTQKIWFDRYRRL